ncbi:MAG: serine/threonine-protein kinase [Acidobacteriota bacterium]
MAPRSPAGLSVDTHEVLSIESPGLDPPVAPPSGAASEARSLELEQTGTAPHRIGPYRLDRLLAQGGSSRVWLAVRDDGEVQQRVAIKVATGASSPESLDRFRLERRILADLKHPNVARLLGGGTTEAGLPYLVMEHVEGLPLHRHCDGLPFAERLALMGKVLAAVGHAHRHLVAHLDLKPANILVDVAGEPRILDFGISKLLGAPAGVTRTPGRRPLTPESASPEQLRGEPLTTASDLYSLGLLLYRVLTGQAPEADGRAEGLEPPPPSRVVAGPLARRLAGDLDAIVGKALRARPDDRYGTVEQFAEDLTRFLEGRPVFARAPTRRYRAGRFLRRRWPLVSLASALFSITLGAAGVVTVQTHHLAEERDRTQLAQREAEDVASFLADMLEPLDPGSAEDALSVPEVLDRGRDALQSRNAPAAVHARLLTTLGATYRSWGRFDDAGPLLERALSIRRRTSEPGHPAVAGVLDQLGRLDLARSDYRSALVHHHEALKLHRRHHGEDHLSVADSYLGLGNAYYELLDLKAALGMYRRGCDIRRRHLGDQHPLTGLCLSNLAGASSSLGFQDEATRLASQAVEIAELHWPEGHTSTTKALNILGQSLLAQRDLEAAERVLRRVVELRLRFYGRHHPMSAEARNNLGMALGQQGKHGESEALFRENLELAVTRYGNNHHTVAKLQHNLGKVLFVSGRLDEAEALFRRSLDTILGMDADNDSIAYSQGALAEVLLSAGRPNEALPLAEEATRRTLRILGPEHTLTRRYAGFLEAARAAAKPAAKPVAEPAAEPAAEVDGTQGGSGS